MTDRALSILMHADDKVGKSTLAVTAPYPRLLLDVEGKSRFLSNQKVKWDPATSEPPLTDGTWDTCVVDVRSFKTAEEVYRWLQIGNHQFRSLIVDSVSELQVLCQEKLVGREPMKTQDWGELLRVMGGFLRDLRNLTAQDTNSLEAFVVTAMTRQVDGMYTPFVQGQLITQMPYWFDVVGYLYVEGDDRQLLTGKDPLYAAGENVQGKLPRIIANPNIETMIDMVFGARPATSSE